jgi:hypothetical protein
MSATDFSQQSKILKMNKLIIIFMISIQVFTQTFVFQTTIKSPTTISSSFQNVKYHKKSM